uniref:NADH:flavin oxidoreductase/NADH oxidase n=1 Tax=uncultured bacterium Contig1514 TaxID=1393445 RepID=W0FJI6_9BACT|nr:NADH:flavin oxidoreductase/NADH oxidase [uncultured bacterium Contig1514]
MNRYPLLTSPIQIGRTIFRNRMFSAPMGATDITPDCSPGPRTQGFYELRAKGGAAAVTVSELVVHPDTDGSHMLHLDLETVGNLAAHTFLADSIRRHGAIPSLQFSHSGQYAGTYMSDKNKKASLNQWGPSDGVRPDGRPVKGLSKEQIADLVRAYGEKAVLAKRAGYEMIMVHAGHGWLLNQFLSPYFNHRTDEYGGPLENRVRLLREVLQTIREAVGPGFPIEVRISGSELFEGGYGVDEGCRIAQAIEDLVDLIHVSAGSYQFGFFDTTPPMFSKHGVNVWLAAEIKKHVSKPVATIGAINDPAQMEQILEEGKADVIYMARELLADPFLPQKVCAGREDLIVRCLRCYTCMAERPTTFTRRCAVNPLIGREIEGMEVPAAARRKKVMVVGGGVAGLKAAVTAAQRGHQVILCEKSDQLGGILKSEQAISFKREMYELGVSLERQAREEGVEIRLNTAVTPEVVAAEHPDAVILAVGSHPIIPDLPGIDGDNVVVVNDYYLEKDKVQDTVVVLGGGLAGCECAIHLGMEGKQVHLVEMRDTLASDCNIRNRPILMKNVGTYVQAHTGLTGVRVTPEGLVCKDKEGKEVLIPGKTVVCAVGQRANRADVDALRGCAPFVREVGDCVRPATITKAVYEGYHAALDI